MSIRSIDRSFRRRLGAITAVGALWRLAYLLVVKLDDTLSLNDSIYYSIQAGRNSEGDWFRAALSDLPGAEHGPLTSLYLTPWSLGAGSNVEWQRFATTLLGIATVAVIGLVGRRLAGPRVGLVAAGIAAGYPNLWINDSLVMSESLACLLVSLALLAALRFHERPGPGGAATLGVLVGLGALTRSEIALFAGGFALLAWWRVGRGPDAISGVRRLAGPAVLLAASLATVSPWLGYNLARFEQPVLLSTNDGTTLLGANCDSTYGDDLGGWDIRCLEPVPTDDTVDASVRSELRREIAVDYIGAHLDRVPIVVVARLGRVLDLYGLSSLVTLDVGEEKAEWAVWAGIASWWILAVAAVVGWRAVGRPGRVRDAGHGDARSADTAGDDPGDVAASGAGARPWLFVPPVAVIVTTALFYGAHRLRAPAEPVVVVLAAAGVVAMFDGWRRRQVPGS